MLIDTYQMMLIVNEALRRKLLNTTFFTAQSVQWAVKKVVVRHVTKPSRHFLRITLPYLCYYAGREEQHTFQHVDSRDRVGLTSTFQHMVQKP